MDLRKDLLGHSALFFLLNCSNPWSLEHLCESDLMTRNLFFAREKILQDNSSHMRVILVVFLAVVWENSVFERVPISVLVEKLEGKHALQNLSAYF